MDKIKIMGILDTPETCDDWPTFKSYLMQNSGINEDISVSYIIYDGSEIMINNDNFDTALAFARAQAIRGEKVTLILNKSKSKHSKHQRKQHTHDGRKEHKEHRHSDKHRRKSRSPKCTIYVNDGEKPTTPKSTFVEKMTREYASESEDERADASVPPEWFTTYMTNFKEEIGMMIRHSMRFSMDLVEIMSDASERRRDPTNKESRRKHSHRNSKNCEEEVSTDEFTPETLPPFISPKLIRYIQKIEAKEKKLERKYEAKIGKLESKVKRIVKKGTAPSKHSKSNPETASASNTKDDVVPNPKKRTPAEVIIANEKIVTISPSQSASSSVSKIPSETVVMIAEPPKFTPTSAILMKPEQSVTRDVVNCPSPQFSSACVTWKDIQENGNIAHDLNPKMVNMNAHPLHRQMYCEYIKRGQIVTKLWEVMNTGLEAWSDDTCLCFTWGSTSLVPLVKCVKVPKLKPGGVGLIKVQMQAPDAVGRFESYWHFYHKNVRFGHWLGCVYVINEDGSESYELPSPAIRQSECKPVVNSSSTDDMKLFKEITDTSEVVRKPESYQGRNDQSELEHPDTTAVLEPQKMNIVGEELKETDDNDSDSDSDNISIISGTISLTSATDQAEEYVMVPLPEHKSRTESSSSSESDASDITYPELIDLEEKSQSPEFQKIEASDCEAPVAGSSETSKQTLRIESEKPEKHFTELEKEKKQQINKPEKFEFGSPNIVNVEFKPPLIKTGEHSIPFIEHDGSNVSATQAEHRRFIFADNGTGFETFELNSSKESTSASQEAEFDIKDRISARYAYVYGSGNRAIPTVESRTETPAGNSSSPDDLKPVHILPETIVTGAIQVAANAFNTACNVYGMIRRSTEDVPCEEQPNGYQVPVQDLVNSVISSRSSTRRTTPTSSRRSSASSIKSQTPLKPKGPPESLSSYESSLKILKEMGFHNQDLNLRLLKRYPNDLSTVISKLI